LSEYLSFLAEDLANNGKLTTNLNEDVPRELLGLRTASQNINPDSTLDNLLRRSQLQIDRSTFIAALNSFIDTDGDGQFNISDEDDDGDGITDRLDLTPYKATSAPTILGIENGKTYSSVQAIELTFQSDEPIDNIQLEIAESSTPDNVTQIVVDGAGYALFLVRGSHQLRARSQNSLGAWSPWSEYYTVEVDMFNKHFGKNMFLGKTYIAESGSGGSYALGATSTGERFQGHFIQGPSASYIASIKNDGGLDWVTVLDTSRYDTPIRLLLADDGSAVAVTHKAWEGINTLIVYNIAATGVVISKTEIEPHLLMMTDPAGYSAVFGAVPFLWEGDGFVIAWFSTVYKFALDGSILWEHRVDPYLVRNFVTYEIRSNKKDEYELLGKYDYPASYDISPKGSQPAVVVINRNFQTNLFDEKYHKHVNTLPTGVYKPRTLTFGTGNTLYLITNSSTSSSLYTIRKTSFSGDPIWSANVETDFSLRDWPSEEFIDKLVEKNGLVYYAMNSKDLVNENQIFSLTTLNTDGSVLKTQKYSYASIHNVEEELPLNESGIVTKTARINNFLVDSEGGFLLSSTITEDNIQSLSLIKTDINGHVGAWSALEGF
ncbi:MAG: thrombospondin type 3 repeat-containing protein, partial [Gammaproteobacteria bacterium]|nr:thrombospondin type 3 repeat-containing protein [Gammaproteobacteria bacterium]